MFLKSFSNNLTDIVFFINLPQNVQGVTLFNKKIYINLKYFEASYIDCLKIATIVLVLLHELHHYYSRFYADKYQTVNYSNLEKNIVVKKCINFLIFFQDNFNIYYLVIDLLKH